MPGPSTRRSRKASTGPTTDEAVFAVAAALVRGEHVENATHVIEHDPESGGYICADIEADTPVVVDEVWNVSNGIWATEKSERDFTSFGAALAFVRAVGPAEALRAVAKPGQSLPVAEGRP